MSEDTGEENHLIGLLVNFDKNLALSYLAKVKAAKEAIESKGLWSVLHSMKDPVLVDPIGLRISLVEPTFVMLSHPICRLRTRVPYPKQIEWERYFVTQLGMIPIYLVNLNVITVLKLWGEDASLAVSKSVQSELEKGDLLLELSPASKPAQYSSMNFVLRYGAPINKAPLELLEPFRMYYRYLFWSFPSNGYTLSSHFLHRRTKITSFMNVTKSLYRVVAVGNPHSVYVEGRSIPCQEAFLTGFNVSQKGIEIVSNIRTMVPEDIAQDLKSKNLSEIFLNAMITELRSDLGTVKLLSNVVEVGESSFDLTETVIGLLAAGLYHATDRPSYVCEVPELKQFTVQILNELFKQIRLPVTLSDSIDNFELALRSLYPFVVVDGTKVLFTHPMIVGFLARQQKLDLLQYGHPALLGLLRLLERVSDTKRPMDIYLDQTMDEFRGASKRDSTNELFSINRRIMLYKHLYRAFNK